jgi:hypothetical protein
MNADEENDGSIHCHFAHLTHPDWIFLNLNLRQFCSSAVEFLAGRQSLGATYPDVAAPLRAGPENFKNGFDRLRLR